LYQELADIKAQIVAASIATQAATQAQIVAASIATQAATQAMIEAQGAKLFNATAADPADQLQEISNGNCLPRDAIPVVWFPPTISSFNAGDFTHERANSLYAFYNLAILDNTNLLLKSKVSTIKRLIGVRR
jgi:hypothetical protein